MILLLPVTTLPVLAQALGGVAVAPASIIPLIWMVFWLALFIFQKGSLPFETIPFLAFVSVGVISSSFAFLGDYPTFKSQSLLGTETSSLLTLAIGACFYLVGSAWLSNHPERLEKTLRMVNYTGLVVLAWSSLQALFAHFSKNDYPELMYQIQYLFNTRGLFRGRVTGFAFEPSWLAHQINLFFLPVWLASSIKRMSVHRFRLWKLTFEDLLLAGGIAMIFLSSRIGTIAILLVIVFLGIRLHIWGLGKVSSAINARIKTKGAFPRLLIRMLIISALLCFLIFLYLLGLFGLVFALANFDPRIARLFDLNSIRLNITSPYDLFNQLLFAERYVYWVTGWHIFGAQPLLGVGLGNAGLYFLDNLPSYGWVLSEVMESVYRLPADMNIKSFWVRILAETGIAGFATFMGWYIVLWHTSNFLEANKKKILGTLGLAGKLVLVAFIAEGFSVDTFALPYLWLMVGFVSAAGMLARSERKMVPGNSMPSGD